MQELRENHCTLEDLSHLALTLAGLKGAVLIVPHHYSFIWRHTPSVGQFAVTVPLASTTAKDIMGCRHICRHCMMRR